MLVLWSRSPGNTKSVSHPSGDLWGRYKVKIRGNKLGVGNKHVTYALPVLTLASPELRTVPVPALPPPFWFSSFYGGAWNLKI